MLVAQLLEQMVVSTRLLDYGRLSAFAKRTASSALQSDTGTCMGLLAILNRLLRFPPLP